MLLARLDADGGSELAACLLGLAGCGLAIPAVLGLMHMLRERWTSPGHVAGAVALAGVGGLGVHYAIELVIWQMAQPDAQRGRTVRVLEDTLTNPVIAGAFEYLPLAFGAGFVALGIILRLADAVEPWTAYFLVAGTGVATAGLFVHDPTMLKVGWGVALAGSNRVGRRVLAQNREDWDHWPSWTFEWTWRR